MGTRGPVPKRSDQRRRRNTPEGARDEVVVEGIVEAPAAKSSWHPIAKRWYGSLAQSGQAVFFEPSDWATAYLVAEEIDRLLKPQALGISPKGEVVKASQPIPGSVLAAIAKLMGSLGVTEGDRRRIGIEIKRQGDGADGEEEADVSDFGEYRRRRDAGQSG